MLTVNLVTVGKLKEAYLRDACAEYVKRLRAFCKINVIELAESKLPENPPESLINKALAREGEDMRNILEVKNAYNIAMCIEGKQLSSEELSSKIEDASVNGASTLNIVIGSSHGIAGEIKEKCHFRLSMSKMTFPHQLARVMVLEQLYRAFSISAGGKYHK